MEPSAAYLQLKALIEKDWMVTDINNFIYELQLIKGAGMITDEEYKSLLDLYFGKFKR